MTAHMSGPEHYRAAELLLAEALDGKAKGRNWSSEWYTNTLLAAQVHATLAHTAATAAGAIGEYSVTDPWRDIVSQRKEVNSEQHSG